jgi:hypothetical protein
MRNLSRFKHSRMVESVTLTQSSGKCSGAEQWWLMELVATPDCNTVVLGSNPAISPAYSGLTVLRSAAIWGGMALRCRLSSEGRQRRI